MDHPPPSNRSLSQQLTVAVILFTMAALAAMAGFASWSVSRVDERALQRQQTAVSFALTEQFENLPVEQTSATEWDDAVLKAKAHDMAWLSDNLTVWMEAYFGHDRDYVIDQQDAFVQAAADGHLVDASLYSKDQPTLVPLIGDLRSQIRRAAEGNQDPAEAIAVLGSEDLFVIDGKLAIVSVKPIVPSTSALTQVPGSEYLQVAVQYAHNHFDRHPDVDRKVERGQDEIQMALKRRDDADPPTHPDVRLQELAGVHEAERALERRKDAERRAGGEGAHLERLPVPKLEAESGLQHDLV